MKKIQFFAVCLCAVLAGFSFASCDDDDDDDSSNGSIIGTWKIVGSGEDDDDYIYAVFCSDGVVYSFEYNSKTSSLSECGKGTYQYNESTGQLTIDGETGTIKIKGNKMYAVDPSGEYEDYYYALKVSEVVSRERLDAIIDSRKK